MPGTARRRAPRRRSTAQREPAAERVVAALRAAILDGSPESGSRIDQQLWADRLQVSRAALREGLKVLTAEKLLEHEEHRGYFVTAFSLAEVREIYWLRVEIEREVLLSLRKPDEREAASLTEACHAALTAADAGDRLERFAAERRFFFGIYALSPHTFLRGEAMRLWDLAETYRWMVTALPPSSRPVLGSFKERRLLQLDAVVSGDRFTLAESVLNDRRRVVASLSGGDDADRVASDAPGPLRLA